MRAVRRTGDARGTGTGGDGVPVRLGGPPRSGRAATALLALVLAAVAVAGHVGHLDEVGITWDEPPYFESTRRIQAWTVRVVKGPDRAAALGADEIRRVWGWDAYHNPHPPVYKEAMAASEAATAGWLGPVAGFRFASLLWFALLVAAVGWIAGRSWGLAAGAAGGLAVLLMPRLVGHAHVAATDMPLTCLFFLAVVGLGRFLREGRTAWGVTAAVAFGLAMGTKFTGYLVPLPVLIWAVAYRVPLRRAAKAVGLAGAAVALSVVVNPLAWHQPASYVAGLVSESLGRADAIPISTMYFGRSYPFILPWHHAVVMTAVTVPVATLGLAGWGAVTAARRWREEWLVGLSVAAIGGFWALLALPSSPNHDGVRLFLPVFPFLGILAGRGFAAVKARLPRAMPDAVRPAAVAVLGALLFVPAVRQTAGVKPFYLSYYNEAIGGLRGAAARGMELTYWFDALTPAFLERVNRTVPGGSRLAAYPTQDHFRFLQDYGLLRPDLTIVDSLPAPYFLQYARTANFDSLQWGLYRRVDPVEAVELDDVRLAALYRWSEADSVEPGPTTGRRPRAGTAGSRRSRYTLLHPTRHPAAARRPPPRSGPAVHTISHAMEVGYSKRGERAGPARSVDGPCTGERKDASNPGEGHEDPARRRAGLRRGGDPPRAQPAAGGGAGVASVPVAGAFLPARDPCGSPRSAGPSRRTSPRATPSGGR